MVSYKSLFKSLVEREMRKAEFMRDSSMTSDSVATDFEPIFAT